MKAFKIIGNEFLPTIILDHATGKFEISGRSIPEKPANLYHQALNWLDKYAESPQPSTELLFSLEFFNVVSSQRILSILHKMESIKEQGYKVDVVWQYEEDDDDLKEVGEDLAGMVELPFTMVPLEVDSLSDPGMVA